MRNRFWATAALAALSIVEPAQAADTGACGERSLAPTASSYTATVADDGTLLSPANATGAATGWAAASLPVTLPLPADIAANWTMCGTSDGNKAIVFAAPSLAAPTTPLLSDTNGGALAARTYYVRITYVNLAGETVGSVEDSFEVGANNLLVVASPGASGNATSWNVYVGTGAGNGTKQNASPIALGTSWTEPLGGLIAGSALSVTGTATATYIIAGDQTRATLTLGPGNAEFVQLLFDGTNYRVPSVSPGTQRHAGFDFGGLPGHWVYPGGPGYQATQGDNGYSISSGGTSGGLTVTLPPIASVAAGWTARFSRDAGKPLEVQGTSGEGAIISFSGGSAESITFAPFNHDFIELQSNGAEYRVIGWSPGTAGLLGVGGAVVHVPTNAVLKTLKGASGVRVIRDGFLAVGDGGGNVPYDWSGTDCATADDGAQVQPTAITGCWIADFTGLQPTPLMWGAVGDGTTNDSVDVQAAIDARQGDVLWLGDSIYRLNTGVTSLGRIHIIGAGGGQGIYNDECTAGLRYGAANIDLITLKGAGSVFEKTCIDSPGFTNTSGRGVYIFSEADRTVVADNQINRACIGIEATGASSGEQLISPVIRTNTIVPAENTACRGGRIGAQSINAATTDLHWLFNQIYCGVNDGNQATRATGLEVNDAGGLYFNGTPPYACAFGTKIIPGASQAAIWGYYVGGLGDSSGVNDLIIDTSDTTSILFGNNFINSWAASSIGGANVKIQNTGNSPNISGHRFVGHRTYTVGNDPGFEILAGKGFVLDSSVVCPGVNNSNAGVIIGGDALQSFVRNNTIGSCDQFGGTLATGISVTTSSTDVGMIVGNELQFSTTRINWAAPANSNAVVETNRGIDNYETGSVASATSITLPMNKRVYVSGTTPITTMLPSWSDREAYIIATNASGFAMNTGGNFCNSATAVQNTPVYAVWNAGSSCWHLK